jgi:DNA-binding transcriptional MerR regulator
MTALTVGDLERELGVSRRQLQYWRERDIVVPTVMTPGGHGRYTPSDVRRVRLALCFRKLGYGGRNLRRLMEEVCPVVEAIVTTAISGARQDLLDRVRID